MLTLTANQSAALASRRIAAAHFVHISLPGEELRVWNGTGNIAGSGYTWIGLGELGVIDGIEASSAAKTGQITVALVGIPASNITPGVVADTRAVRYQGRAIDISLGLMNPDTGALIDNLVPLWAGFCDTMTMAFGQTFSVALTAERYDSIMSRANGNRMTTYSHNQRLGNPATPDLFFEAQDRQMGVSRPALS